MEALLSRVPGGVEMTTTRVMFSHSDKSRTRIDRAEVREGTEVYRHPEGYFVVLEFQGESGKFREAFCPEEVVKQELFL
jgi:hypothetical protein